MTLVETNKMSNGNIFFMKNKKYILCMSNLFITDFTNKNSKALTIINETVG